MRHLVLILCFFSTLSNSLKAQESTLFIQDSLKVDSIFNRSSEFLDSEPVMAKGILDSLVNYIDKELLPIYRDHSYLLSKKALSLERLGYLYRRENKFDEARSFFEESINLKRRTEDFETIARTYYQIGWVWIYQSEFEKTKLYLDTAYALSKKYKDINTTATVLSGYGTLFQNLKDFKQADFYHQAALRFTDSLGNKARIAAASSNYASFLRQQKRYQENIPYLEKSIKLHEELDNNIGLESGYYALGVTYRLLEQPNRAIIELKKALALSRKLNNEALLHTRYLELSRAYEMKGDDKMALEYYKEYKRSLLLRLDQDSFKKLTKIEAEYAYQKKSALDSLRYERQLDKEAAIIEKRNDRKFWLVVTSLLVVTTILLFFYLQYRNKVKRAEQKIKEQQYKNIILNKTVESKTKEINTLLAETIQHIKKKEQLAEELKKVADEESGASLQSILLGLKADKIDDGKLLVLKDNIENINTNFIQNLKGKHPELTKTDIEICTFIKLGLSRKEIAGLRNTSIDAIKSSRFRLKKKFELSHKDSLDNYIGTF